MTLIDRIDQTLAEHGSRLRRASPRTSGRLTIEAVDDDGGVAAAQWFEDPAEAKEAARLLVDRFGADDVRLLDEHLLLQRAGTDRKLPSLRRVVARPGSVLVAHRAERRAVVRTREGRYVKVVRPDRLDELLQPLASIRLPGVLTPSVRGVDERRGCVTTDPLPGRTFHERLRDDTVTDATCAGDARLAGRALRALHASGVETSRPAHTARDELAAARRWLDAAQRLQLLDPDACARALDAVSAELLGTAEPPAPVHRDFHDKQVLVDGATVGMLDLDLACPGEPSVDVANLVAHVDLRRLQGHLDAGRAATVTGAFLGAYGEQAVRVDRFGAYLASTRLRLAGVYAFRPSRPGLCDELLAAATSRAAPRA